MRGMKGVVQKGMEFAMELGLWEIIEEKKRLGRVLVFSQAQTQRSICWASIGHLM